MSNPGSSNGTIQSLINDVQAWLQNRADVSESQSNPDMRPSRWIRKAIENVTQQYRFEELRTLGPTVSIGPGLGFQGSNYLYPVSMFLNPGDDYQFNESMVIFISPTVSYPMDYMQPKAIAPLLNVPGGVSFKYTRYGANFWFGVQSGIPYQVYFPYQRVHPFIEDNVPGSPVFLPKEWLEIVSVDAARRGAVKNRWNDQATYLYQMLHGDAAYQNSAGEKGTPGLLAPVLEQQTRDEMTSVRQIIPVATRY